VPVVADGDNAGLHGSRRGVPRGVWWDALPGTYVLRKVWGDIVAFHTALSRELCRGGKLDTLGLKSKLPPMPEEDEIDKWVHAVVATGDACALARRGTPSKHEELEDLQTVYIHHLLAPLCEGFAKFLNEVPLDLLESLPGLRRFIGQDGAVMQAVQDSMVPPMARLFPSKGSSPSPTMALHRHASAAARAERASEKTRGSSLLVGEGVSGGGGKQSRASVIVDTSSEMSPHGSSLNNTGGRGSVGGGNRLPTLRQSDSSPSFLNSPDSSPRRSHRGERGMPAPSHYDWFAQTVQGASCGFASGKEMKKLMLVKERRANGRRSTATSVHSCAKRALMTTGSFVSSCQSWAPKPSGEVEDFFTSGEADGDDLRTFMQGYLRSKGPSLTELCTDQVGERRKATASDLSPVRAKRQTMIQFGDVGNPMAASGPCRQLQAGDELAQTSSMCATWADNGKAARSNSMDSSAGRVGGATNWEDVHQKKDNQMKQDICMGLRVILLGELPPQGPRGVQERKEGVKEKESKEGTQDEALRVYRFYQKLLMMQDREEKTQEQHCGSSDVGGTSGSPSGMAFEELDSTPRLGASSSGGFDRSGGGGTSAPCAAQSDSPTPTPREPLRTSLIPISWSTFSLWVERQCDFATHYKFKSACNALVRALARWRSNKQKQAQLKRLQRITLFQIFAWMWPEMKFLNFSNMLNHACHSELEKIRVPTPDVIPAAERRQLQEIFKRLDTGKRGYCTADDLAGGSVQTIKAKLNNIVDAHTVKMVCGDGKIKECHFLELMVEEGMRATDKTINAYWEGQRICRIHREVSGFSGWVFETVPKHEVRQRQLVDGIEDEVLFWRHLDKGRTRHGFWSPGRDTMASMPLPSDQPQHRWGPIQDWERLPPRTAMADSRSSMLLPDVGIGFNLPEQTRDRFHSSP